ncbi:MAG: ABC transporter permease [Acidobacteria bacterium]|nr:ABC transporter permease [Acidobacteriota bacterium]
MSTRSVGLAGICVMYAAGLLAGVLAPAGYADQDREHPDAPPSRAHWLGTDELGRDRWSRLLHGTRVSLLLAPAAAVVATALAAAAGLTAAVSGKWTGEAMALAFDVLLSLPLLFLLLALRASLPLNVSAWASLAITFALLALLGWPSAARVARAGALAALESTFALQARAAGIGKLRLLAVHLLPHLRPVVAAQFWLLVPAFILGEANLGILGLGVVEPLPSWGSLLGELQNLDSLRAQPWRLAPAAALLIAVCCFHLAGKTPAEEA